MSCIATATKWPWWGNLQISPLEVAKDLWQKTPIHNASSISSSADQARTAGEVNQMVPS
jgi:hypothetical protein